LSRPKQNPSKHQAQRRLFGPFLPVRTGSSGRAAGKGLGPAAMSG